MGFRVPYIIIADSIQEVGRGKLNILGIFDQIFMAHELPAPYEGFTVAALIVAETEDELGEHRIGFRLTRPNGQILGEVGGPIRFTAAGGAWPLAAQRFAIAMGGPVFREYGPHALVVLVDGSEVARHPILVSPAPSAPTPPPR